MAENDLRNHLIEEYFHMGFNYKEIIDCLFLNNGIPLSLRQLKVAPYSFITTRALMMQAVVICARSHKIVGFS